MQSHCPKRVPLLTAVASAVVVAMAAPAFACTAFQGTVTVTATGPLASGTGTYKGDGGDQTTPTKGYCDPPSRTNLTTLGTFRLDVVPGPACPTTTATLPAGTYLGRGILATADTGASHEPQFDCNTLHPGSNPDPDPTKKNLWFPLVGTGVEVGTDPEATYSGEFVLPPKIGKVNVCLSVVAPGNANLSPPMVFLNLI